MNLQTGYKETDVKALPVEPLEYQESDRKEDLMTQEFKDLAERLNEGIYRFDMEARKFIFFNKTAIGIFGRANESLDDITPKAILLRIHPEDLAPVRAAAREARKPGRNSGEVEYRYAKPDGAYAWIYDRWIVMRDSTGKPRYLEGIVMDNTKRKLAEEALKQSRKKLRLLSSHLLKAQETERRRISRELHDELGQALMVLKLQLGSIKRKIPMESVDVREDIENTLKYVNLIVENVRRLSHDLSPSILEDLGLDAAMRLLIKEFVDHSHVQVSCDIQSINRLFSKENQIIIYRILQETFTNIEKHSRASQIWISIKNKNDTVILSIKDNGVGFDSKQSMNKIATERTLGLTTMDERARMLEGSLKIESEKGSGTLIVFSIPTDESGDTDEFLPNSIG